MPDDFLDPFKGFLRGESKRMIDSLYLREEESLLEAGSLGSFGGSSFGPLPDC